MVVADKTKLSTTVCTAIILQFSHDALPSARRRIPLASSSFSSISSSPCGWCEKVLVLCFSQITFGLISLLVAQTTSRDLLVSAKDLLIEANGGADGFSRQRKTRPKIVR
jgi:hypothetical protein